MIKTKFSEKISFIMFKNNKVEGNWSQISIHDMKYGNVQNGKYQTSL
jgi:hypothetical protein